MKEIYLLIFYVKFQKKTIIPTITINKYCKSKRISHIDFLKIDTEGNDFNVLLSSNKLLLNKIIKLIKIEVIIKKNFNKIYNILYYYGYEILGFTNQKYKDDKLFFCDVFFMFKKISFLKFPTQAFKNILIDSGCPYRNISTHIICIIDNFYTFFLSIIIMSFIGFNYF